MGSSSSLELRLKVLVFRFLAAVFSWFDRHLSTPLPPSHTFEVEIPATLSKQPGSIRLLFYTPASYKQPLSFEKVEKKYPFVINFHGGGFVLGSASDDARWAAIVTQKLDAVCVSVDYRLAPDHPFPTPVEDCANAIQWLWEYADQYALDRSKTVVSGFSAGANFSLTGPLRLQEEARTPSSGEMKRIVAFYPGVDWTKSRDERTASNAISARKSPIPKVLFDVFDRSYLSTEPDMASPYLSPGVADEQLLVDGLPQRIMIISCEWDQLLMEEERFRKRLMDLGKTVSGSMVREVAHGWDKKPTFRRGEPKRDQAYKQAVEEMKMMFAADS